MEPGTVVGNRFKVIDLAARGGMGAVYRAEDRTSGEIVALKTMHATLSDQEAERLVREGAMLAALEHAGIVRHVSHGIDLSAGVFVAMEWVEGVTLRKRLASEGLTVRESVDVVRRVAEALGHAHRAGLIHRDIKPSNIILREGDVSRPVLIDFGVARAGGVSELTQTGMMLGTPHFMAPEQARGSRDVDARADVFALGGLLFHCLTGKHVFEAESLMGLLAKVLLEDAPDVRALAPNVPDVVAEIVARMLSKLPSQRPADGVLAAEALAAARFEDAEVLDRRARPTGGHEMLTGTERRLVSVIVAKMPPRKSATDEETQVVAATPEGRSELVQVLSGLGARSEVLADGTFLAAVSGFGSALDQAAIAARCALRMRRELGGMAMALVTGRAVLDPSSTGGLGTNSGRGTDVFERAASLLARECTDLVAVDEVTAGLLDGRFDVAAGASGLVLRGEREVVAATRTFLGRAMACVGRDRELAVLRAVWEEVASESVARVVLVTAPAGVGKSRLRWEFLNGVETAGEPHSVLFARGDAVTTTAPYALLGQALRRAAGITDGSPHPFARLRARVARTVTKDATEIAELLGEVAQAPSSEPSMRLRAARNDPALMAERVAWAFESFVAAESAAQPLLLVFEDLHWGDALTVALVDRVLDRRPDTPWLVLALARPEIHTTFPGLWSERAVQPVPLSALSKKAAERLVREALGPSVQDDTVERIVHQGSGNALYLEELVRAESEGRAGSSSSLLAMVQSRIEALDGEERRVLRASSIFGQTAWTGGVVALLQQGSADAIDDVLRALEKRELLARRGEGRFPNTTEFIFRHALVRDAAYEMLTPDDASLGHRLAGEWLESAGERDAFVLARHYERGGSHDRAVKWFLRAAERALGANAFGTVLEVCDRALALDPTPPARGALLTLRAEACRWSGDTTTASDDASAALALLPPGSKEWLMAIRTAGHASSFGGLRGRLPALALQLLAVEVADAAVGEYIVAATQVASGTIVSGMRDVGFRILERVASFDPKAFEDDPGVLARLHSCAGLRAYDRGDYEWLLTEQLAMVSCHVRAGDDRSALTQRVNVAFAHMMMGEFEQAIAGPRQTEAESTRLGLWATALTARQNIGFALYSVGRLDEAQAIEEEVSASAASRSAARIGTLARRCLALIACARGDAAKAVECAKLAVDESPDGPVRMASLAVLADALVLAGRVHEARGPAVEALAQLEAGNGAAFVGDLSVRAAYAAMLDAAGDREGAAAAVRAALAVVEARAAKMSKARRQTFLERVPEATRIRALAARLLTLG